VQKNKTFPKKEEKNMRDTKKSPLLPLWKASHLSEGHNNESKMREFV
jgi:hypothetical protein